jgi:hypothetical protein
VLDRLVEGQHKIEQYHQTHKKSEVGARRSCIASLCMGQQLGCRGIGQTCKLGWAVSMRQRFKSNRSLAFMLCRLGNAALEGLVQEATTKPPPGAEAAPIKRIDLREAGGCQLAARGRVVGGATGPMAFQDSFLNLHAAFYWCVATGYSSCERCCR